MFAGGLLSLIVPPELCWAGGGLATLSWLSQRPCPHVVTAREGKGGVCRWGGTVGHRQGPLIPQGPQPALLSPWPAGTLSPTRASGVPSPSLRPMQGVGHPRRGRVPSPTQGRVDPMCGTGQGRGVPPAAATGTSQALTFNVHKERGGGQGRPVLGEQVDVAIPWGQSQAERAARGRSPPNPGSGARAPTHLPACWPGAG